MFTAFVVGVLMSSYCLSTRHKWTRRQHLACGLVSLSIVLILSHAVSDKLHSRIRAGLASSISWAGTSSFGSSIVDLNPTALGDSLPEGLSSNTKASDANDPSPTLETTLALPNPPPGFAIFDRLYVRNKTFYAVTSEPSTYPALKYILSQPEDMSKADISPTDKVSEYKAQSLDSTLSLRNPQEMRIISPEEAQDILGSHAVVLSGMSYIIYDTAQFMKVSSPSW